MTKQEWITALRGHLGLAPGPEGGLGDLDGLDDLAELDSLPDPDDLAPVLEGARAKRIQALLEEIDSWETGVAATNAELDELIAAGDLDEATADRAAHVLAQLDARLREAIAELDAAISELEG